LSQIKVEYVNHCGDDLSVVDAARCSFDKKSEWEKIPSNTPNNAPEEQVGVLKQSDVKLINYLANHKHYSPFNHSFISVRVKAPVFVARQLVKHKFMPWNEVSRRYVKDEPEFYTPESWRKAAENVKQGSSSESISEGDSFFNPHERIKNGLKNLVDQSVELYNEILEEGGCAEQARMALPQNMMTTWIWSGTLGAFCDMLVLRLDEHTQLETRVVAQQVAEIVKELFPVSYKALVEK
jgi:thymidylate synthase (FAD)